MIFLENQVIEVDVSVHSARGETHIVLPPIYASDLVHVALALVVRRALLCVEVVNVYRIQADCTCKEMATIAEFDLTALFNL